MIESRFDAVAALRNGKRNARNGGGAGQKPKLWLAPRCEVLRVAFHLRGAQRGFFATFPECFREDKCCATERSSRNAIGPADRGHRTDGQS